MATTTDTFSALIDCFSADLAALIEEDKPESTSRLAFIEQVERARDILGAASIGCLQDASEELDFAVTSLTDALTSTPHEKRMLLAKARTHLRDAMETAA